MFRRARNRNAPSLFLWWLIMVLGSLTSLGLNLWHACTQPNPGGHIVLAITYAVVPVGFAALLSEGLRNPLLGKFSRGVIICVFVLAMGMSIAAQALVMMRYGGVAGGIGIPVILDTSTLLSLQVITKAKSVAAKEERERAYEEAVAARLAVREREMRHQMDEDMAAARAAIQEAADADKAARLADARTEIEAATAAKYEADIAAAEADMRHEFQAATAARAEAIEENAAKRVAVIEAANEADIARRVATERAAAEADTRTRCEADMAVQIAAIRNDYEAAVAARVADAEAAMAARYTENLATARVAIEADVRREHKAAMAATGAATRKAVAARRPLAALPKVAGDGELSSKDKARIELDRNPDLDGAELADLIGVSPRTGRRLLADLRAEQSGHATTDTDMTADDAAMLAATEAVMAADDADSTSGQLLLASVS
ncbi:hypothetical protein ACQP25_44315 (plasmid) [Microtetraspora malaysiensis]|uniref:hypothetical protein n=1 Tax=Microtetraspora malaysiensis TaxID=161358 RepID=UPI003D8E31EA